LIVLGQSDLVADWVAHVSGKPFARPYEAIGIASQGRLVGGMVFTGYNGDGVEVSIAGRSAREGWRAAVDYAFGQLGCSRLQVHTRYSNKTVKAMLPRMGFTFEGPARKFYGTEDGLTYSLTIDDLPRFKARWRL
jgi:RimJ/RimL family protein N-acetyltransferase